MNYREKFYEIYKQKWLRNNVGENELANAIMEEYKSDSNFQFKNGMYVSYFEFINNEYQDEEVMKFILNDDKLFEIYLREKDNKCEELIDKIIKDSDCEYYDRLDDFIRYTKGLECDDEFNVIIKENYSTQTLSLEEYLNTLTEEELEYIVGDEEDEEE